jgi:DNA-binding phage protein
MTIVLSCKTKDKGLKQKLERYARANGLSKSKAIEELLNKTLQNRDNNGFTAGILKEKKAVNSLLSLLSKVEAESKQLRHYLKKGADLNP